MVVASPKVYWLPSAQDQGHLIVSCRNTYVEVIHVNETEANEHIGDHCGERETCNVADLIYR